MSSEPHKLGLNYFLPNFFDSLPEILSNLIKGVCGDSSTSGIGLSTSSLYNNCIIPYY